MSQPAIYPGFWPFPASSSPHYESIVGLIGDESATCSSQSNHSAPVRPAKTGTTHETLYIRHPEFATSIFYLTSCCSSDPDWSSVSHPKVGISASRSRGRPTHPILVTSDPGPIQPTHSLLPPDPCPDLPVKPPLKIHLVDPAKCPTRYTPPLSNPFPNGSRVSRPVSPSANSDHSRESKAPLPA